MKFVCPSPRIPRPATQLPSILAPTRNVKLPQSAAYLCCCLQHSLGAIFTFWLFDTRAAPVFDRLPHATPRLHWKDHELLPKCSWPPGRVGACGRQECDREWLEKQKKYTLLITFNICTKTVYIGFLCIMEWNTNQLINFYGRWQFFLYCFCWWFLQSNPYSAQHLCKHRYHYKMNYHSWQCRWEKPEIYYSTCRHHRSSTLSSAGLQHLHYKCPFLDRQRIAGMHRYSALACLYNTFYWFYLVWLSVKWCWVHSIR